MRHWLGGALVLLVAVVCCRVVLGADQPQWGEAWSRNMVAAE